MSHTVTVKTDLKDKSVIVSVCKKLGLEITQEGGRLFGGQESGMGIKLPGWQYPIVVKEDGSVAYDNYNGRWGAEEELHKLTANYGAEKARIEAARMGYEVHEWFNQETSEIEVSINVGEEAA